MRGSHAQGPTSHHLPCPSIEGVPGSFSQGRLITSTSLWWFVHVEEFARRDLPCQTDNYFTCCPSATSGFDSSSSPRNVLSLSYLRYDRPTAKFQVCTPAHSSHHINSGREDVSRHCKLAFAEVMVDDAGHPQIPQSGATGSTLSRTLMSQSPFVTFACWRCCGAALLPAICCVIWARL